MKKYVVHIQETITRTRTVEIDLRDSQDYEVAVSKVKRQLKAKMRGRLAKGMKEVHRVYIPTIETKFTGWRKRQ